jgi:hypothetical protein
MERPTKVGKDYSIRISRAELVGEREMDPIQSHSVDIGIVAVLQDYSASRGVLSSDQLVVCSFISVLIYLIESFVSNQVCKVDSFSGH